MASTSNVNNLNYNLDNSAVSQTSSSASLQSGAPSTAYDPITTGLPLGTYRPDSLGSLQMAAAQQNLYYPNYSQSFTQVPQHSAINSQVTSASQPQFMQQGSSMMFQSNPSIPAVSYSQYDRFMSHARPSVNSNPYPQYSLSTYAAPSASSSGVSQSPVHGIPKLNPVSNSNQDLNSLYSAGFSRGTANPDVPNPVTNSNQDLNALYSAGISRVTANPDGPRKQTLDEMLYSASEFVRKMFNLISDPAEHQYIRWASNGDSFVIVNQNDFAREILPRFFKHCNFSSFVRQLNKYGFHKIRNSSETKDLSSGAWEFHHPYFRRDYPQYLVNVKRKNDKTSSSSGSAPSHSASSSANTPMMPTFTQVKPIQPVVVANEQLQIPQHSMAFKPSMTTASLPDTEPEQDQSFMAEPNVLVESLQNEIGALSDNQKRLEETIFDLSKKFSFVYEELIRVKTTLAGYEARFAHHASTDQTNQMASIVYGNDLQQQEQNASSSQNNVEQTLKHRVSHDNLERGDKKLRVSDDGQSKSHIVIPEWSQAPRVLLVEDDPTCRSVSAKLLQIFGCEYDMCSDGATAIKKMNSDSYDLVLMDIVMPTMDGVSATNLIRQFDPVTPIISMTSNLTEKDCMTYLSSGMTDILAKPFSKANLYEILLRYCGHLCKSSGGDKPKETPRKSRDSNYMQMVNYSPADDQKEDGSKAGEQEVAAQSSSNENVNEASGNAAKTVSA